MFLYEDDSKTPLTRIYFHQKPTKERDTNISLDSSRNHNGGKCKNNTDNSFFLPRPTIEEGEITTLTI